MVEHVLGKTCKRAKADNQRKTGGVYMPGMSFVQPLRTGKSRVALLRCRQKYALYFRRCWLHLQKMSCYRSTRTYLFQFLHERGRGCTALRARSPLKPGMFWLWSIVLEINPDAHRVSFVPLLPPKAIIPEQDNVSSVFEQGAAKDRQCSHHYLTGALNLIP